MHFADVILYLVKYWSYDVDTRHDFERALNSRSEHVKNFSIFRVFLFFLKEKPLFYKVCQIYKCLVSIESSQDKELDFHKKKNFFFSKFFFF